MQEFCGSGVLGFRSFGISEFWGLGVGGFGVLGFGVQSSGRMVRRMFKARCWDALAAEQAHRNSIVNSRYG